MRPSGTLPFFALKTSFGSRRQERQPGRRCEVTYLRSFSLQDCQLWGERARAGAPPHCSQPATTIPLPFSSWGQNSLVTFPPNMAYLFLPLDLDFGLCCIPCLLRKSGESRLPRKPPALPEPWPSLLTAPSAPAGPAGSWPRWQCSRVVRAWAAEPGLWVPVKAAVTS